VADPTPADRIRAAVEAKFKRSPAPRTIDDLAAAVCDALADVVVPQEDPSLPTGETKASRSTLWRERMAIRSEILAIAAELRGCGNVVGTPPANPA
jgi:hypothetical protein